jgi:hypothetical protein
LRPPENLAQRCTPGKLSRRFSKRRRLPAAAGPAGSLHFTSQRRVPDPPLRDFYVRRGGQFPVLLRRPYALNYSTAAEFSNTRARSATRRSETAAQHQKDLPSASWSKKLCTAK